MLEALECLKLSNGSLGTSRAASLKALHPSAGTGYSGQHETPEGLGGWLGPSEDHGGALQAGGAAPITGFSFRFILRTLQTNRGGDGGLVLPGGAQTGGKSQELSPRQMCQVESCEPYSGS